MACWRCYIIVILLLVNFIEALEVCEDHYVKCPNSDCGLYPLMSLYRLHCMKSCGVCTDRNRALGKPTAQSSTIGSGLSSQAVDGDLTNELSCSMTNNSDHSIQWWCVDLQQIYSIDNIKIYRTNIRQHELNNFQVKLGLSESCNQKGFGSATTCYTDNNRTTQSVYTITSCNHHFKIPLMGRVVFISIHGSKAPPLSLCEVGIFTGTKCGDGYFSANATTCTPCDTCSDNSCESNSGICWDGCMDGYMGEACRQCSTGRFGPGCRLACNTTMCRGNCDRHVGTCRECKSGFYGSNCQATCSQKCVNNVCHKTDGRCFKETVKEVKLPIADDNGTDRTLVGIIGVLVGVAVACIAVFVCRLVRKRRKLYKLDNPPPSKRVLDTTTEVQYISSDKSVASAQYTEVRPEYYSKGSQCVIRREIPNKTFPYALARPCLDQPQLPGLPENEKRRLNSQISESTCEKTVNYQNESFNMDDISLYESAITDM